jgi:threonine dehydratase
VTEQPFDETRVAGEVARAEARIRPYVRETPLEPSPYLSRETGAAVYLKCENLQVSGSFKGRGAFSKLLSLDPDERARGVTTASTGNHANAMAHALSLLGIPGEIFLARSASPAKVEALRMRGANLCMVDGDPGDVETIAHEAAERSGRAFVSPYNDPQVIGGQGTIAIELLRQMAALSPPAVPDAVFVPVGGGGLIAGIAGYLKAAAPHITVVGCQPAASPVMAESVKAGHMVAIPMRPSLSDATVGLIPDGTYVLPVNRSCVDEWVLIEEDEIAAALRLVLGRHSMMVEGAAVLSVAALLKTKQRFAGKTVALVLSGSRISLPVLARVLTEG